MRKRRCPDERFAAEQIQHPHRESDGEAEQSRRVHPGRSNNECYADQQCGDVADPDGVLRRTVQDVVPGVCRVPGATDHAEPFQ